MLGNLYNSYAAPLDKADTVRKGKGKIVYVHVIKACGGVATHSWPRQ